MTSRRSLHPARWAAAAAVLLWVVTARADEDDLYRFFESESEVATAVRQRQTLRSAPSTVYVVTGAELSRSGGQGLWESLRGLPGVQVMTMRAYDGSVSIRGLGKPLNNRTLVLLDGRTQLNSFFDFVTWDAIPGIPGEIAQIEVMEGPASALYGPNAINGVVNIVSKAPEQLQGGEAGLSGGEGRSYSTHLLYGRRQGRLGYKIAASRRAGDGFDAPAKRSSEVSEAHGLVDCDLPAASRLSLSAGVSRLNTEMTTGSSGLTYNDGKAGFAHLTYAHPRLQVQGFWNWGRGVLREYRLLVEPNMDYDTAELSVEHEARLPARNRLVIGASYRYHAMRSRVLADGKASQNLWAPFFEDAWQANPRLRLVASARADRHPLTGVVVSPRISVSYAPNPGHAFRAAAATAFRNPNLSENHLSLREDLAIPPFVSVPRSPDSVFTRLLVDIVGNRDLKPEQIRFLELAHRGQFGPVRTGASLFYYSLRNLSVQTASLRSTLPPVIEVGTSWASEGRSRAAGGELAVQWRWRPWLAPMGNYSYQRTRGAGDPLAAREGGPSHQASAGVEVNRERLSASAWAHWVGATRWPEDMPVFPGVGYGRVDAYLLVNAFLGYALSATGAGSTEVGVGSYNLLDYRHYEILPYGGPDAPGQYGERLRRRLRVSLVQRF